MFLFDTDVLSNLTRKRPAQSLLAKLARTHQEDCFTSSITLAEIYYGLQKWPDRKEIVARLEEKVFPLFVVFDFDESSAKCYGEIRAHLERKGQTRDDLDLQIAAIALQHRLTLVTGNVKHFRGIPGLVVENWLGS
ncbi:MAG: type II toxin-antitoxin system VapC family toxin [Candidatus Aminicenantes bacterium]|nr:type II toxin-antitoxin system VapC family toxin [Candidatus Aminicenantes bacterium]